MKKYIEPRIGEIFLEAEQLLVKVSGDGPTGGGLDPNPEQPNRAPRYGQYDDWDDDEDEEDW